MSGLVDLVVVEPSCDDGCGVPMPVKLRDCGPCAPLDLDNAAELEFLNRPWTIAVAIESALMDLLACIRPDCGEHETKLESEIRWGEPAVRPNCCGNISVGILTPVLSTRFGNLIENDACFSNDTPWTYRAEVTWNRNCTRVSQVAMETRWLQKHLKDRLCCLLKPAVCRLDATNTGVDNIPTGNCHRVVFTFEIA